MPGPSYFGTSRISAFDAYLTDNAVPINGVGISADAPAGVSIDFKPEATAEQIAWATNARDTFDWRRRRPLSRNTIVTALANLTTAQQNAILRHIAAFIGRQNPSEVASLAAVVGISLPVDEVDPTETVPT